MNVTTETKTFRLFTFDKRTALSEQIQEYIRNYITGYYKENYYDVNMQDVFLEPSSYVFAFFTRMTINKDDRDNRERTKKSDKYLQKLDTPEGAICLSKLTPANVFEMCPIYLSIRISLSEFQGDKKECKESAEKQLKI